MRELIFWIIYIIGGALFVLFTIKANKIGRARGNILSSKGNILYSLPLVYRGELFWIICWIIGLVIYPSIVSVSMGVVPLVMPLITFSSIFFLKFKGFLEKRDRGEKRYVKNHINEWTKQLPAEVKLKSINYAMNSNRDIINGRVIIFLCSNSDIQGVNWSYLGGLLEKEINQPLIIQIKLNNKNVYPLL
ncbi:hypothetical protein NSS74_01180 [Bacillus sp. FSL E2-8868]|uniref:hypothetical protein n=1 Tax=Bacillus sp. FSL E2-8868 TaxID=2954598 RepID=UPI0030FCEABA